jgi:hypothetical protein
MRPMVALRTGARSGDGECRTPSRLSELDRIKRSRYRTLARSCCAERTSFGSAVPETGGQEERIKVSHSEASGAQHNPAAEDDSNGTRINPPVRLDRLKRSSIFCRRCRALRERLKTCDRRAPFLEIAAERRNKASRLRSATACQAWRAEVWK